MPKREVARPGKRRIKVRRPVSLALAITICLAASALAFVRLRAVRTHFGLAPVAAPGTAAPTPRLSKEYVYAGGRLLATEEPGAPRAAFPDGVAHPVPGTIQAEDFDLGGEGVAYHDHDPEVNQMGAYRPSPSGVDIEPCGAAGSGCGFNVGHTWGGEWVEYTVNVAEGGDYDVEVRVASGNGGGGSFHLALDGRDVTGALAVPDTGGWQSYQLVRKPGVTFTDGQHVLRLSLDRDGPRGGVANFDFIRLSRGGAGPAPEGLLATFQPAAQVRVAWAAPAGAVDHYEVERAESPAGPYQTLSADQRAAEFLDPVGGGAARVYFYRVRAAWAGGGLSPYSNVDMAVTVAFADDPLNQGGSRTPVKALHFAQLREAVNAARAAAALPPFDWAGAAPGAGGAIRAGHLNELRVRLREALAALNLPPPAYDAPDPMSAGQPVRASNVQQLRNLLK